MLLHLQLPAPRALIAPLAMRGSRRACRAPLAVVAASMLWLLCPAAAALAPIVYRPAQFTDCWGVARVCVESFYDAGATIEGGDPKLAWAAAVARRLRAIGSGALRPHAIVVAIADGAVAGVAEVGLLPAPPGARASSRSARPSPEAAAWRGVAVDDARAWAAADGDVPTLANVAVDPALRRRSIGRDLVAAASTACAENDDWVAWRRAGAAGEDAGIYARVTEDDAVDFWRGIGFEAVDTAGGATDVRGRGGLWLRRDLGLAAAASAAPPPPPPPPPSPWWARKIT